MILLRRSGREWGARDVAQELRATQSAIELRLDDLVRRGLVRKSDSGYVFSAPHNVASVVDELANQYSIRRTTVIQLIFTAPSDSVRSFADAFRLRSESEDED